MVGCGVLVLGEKFQYTSTDMRKLENFHTQNTYMFREYNYAVQQLLLVNCHPHPLTTLKHIICMPYYTTMYFWHVPLYLYRFHLW